MILLQALVDILHIDDGIIHQRPYGYAHASQCHGIDFHAYGIDNNQGGQKAHGDGHNGDDGGAEIAQEQEENDDDENGSLQQCSSHIVNR